MNINTAFPSDYFKGAILKDEGDQTLTIASVELKEVGKDKDRRPVVYFKGDDRGLILNKTNAGIIQAEYGPETSDWVGKPLRLTWIRVQFQGDQVDGVGVEIPDAEPVAATA